MQLPLRPERWAYCPLLTLNTHTLGTVNVWGLWQPWQKPPLRRLDLPKVYKQCCDRR